MTEAFEVHTDGRGMLLPIDLTALGFTPSRVFVVTGPLEAATRGGHTVPCRELVVLVSGRAEVRHGSATTCLDQPGDALMLEPGEEMDYDLAEGGSTILVLADAPYDPERP